MLENILFEIKNLLFIFLRASGKERALKEIRYLAVLNHPNLIQYYYAWNESPPVGWQEKVDETLLARNSTTARYFKNHSIKD